MSEAQSTWRKKLDYLQQQEAIVSDPAQKFTLQEQIAEAKAKIAELEAASENHSPQVFQSDISRIVKYAPEKLIGRESETKRLNDAWAKVQNHETPRPHILTFVALGGEGKTSLVAKWAADLAAQDWPECDAVFAWSFYSQGTREQNAASSDLFLAEALRFFGDAAMAESAAGAFDKGRRLAQLAGERRALLILDGLEPLQYAPTSPLPGELKDQGLAALLKGLAANNRGLCVVTTRYPIPDLRAFSGKTVHEEKLTRLSTEAGVALLQALGVQGSLRKTIPTEKPIWNEFEKLVEDVQGHALTLQIFGQFLVRAFQSDIRRRDRVNFEKADAKIQGGHAFRAIEAYVKWMEADSDEARREVAVLKLLGLFDRPATADCIAVLRQAPVIPGLTEPLVDLKEEEDWEFSLSSLQNAKLLTVNRDAAGTLLALDAHPLLREYFAKRLKDEGGRMKGGETSSFQLAHRRLYEHLCEDTKDKPNATLEDLQPLYQAVAHGCQAGLQQEACEKVYRDRILRGTGDDGFYSTKKLGAFGSDLGAVACFFETPWHRVSPALTAAAQAWLLNEAAFRLRALGRLTESLEPMRAALERDVKRESWKEAAISASNLSELELTLGAVAGAVRDAEQSVDYADRSGDANWRYASRTTHADALHQAGRCAEAEARFSEAEQLQANDQPDYPLLYSLPGFRYCDLLLAQAEQAAWGKDEGGGMKNELLAVCRAVSERAAQTLKWAEDYNLSLLTRALDQLMLGRAALYEAMLSAASPSSFLLPTSSLDSAVSGLRRAGHQQYLPLGLLTRAWLRGLTGARSGPDSAQSDLDEAGEIAERGSMRLFMADIHLYRARLFGSLKSEVGSRNEEVKYPWESPAADLAAAEKLINDCGYHRRDAELADAKRAMLG